MLVKLIPKTLVFGFPFLHRREHTHIHTEQVNVRMLPFRARGQELLLAKHSVVIVVVVPRHNYKYTDTYAAS